MAAPVVNQFAVFLMVKGGLFTKPVMTDEKR